MAEGEATVEGVAEEAAEAAEIIVATTLVVTAPEAAAGDEEGLVLPVHVLAPDRERARDERVAAVEAVAIVTIPVVGEIVTIAKMKRRSTKVLPSMGIVRKAR